MRGLESDLGARRLWARFFGAESVADEMMTGRPIRGDDISAEEAQRIMRLRSCRY
jgi:hypothetical protein